MGTILVKGTELVAKTSNMMQELFAIEKTNSENHTAGMYIQKFGFEELNNMHIKVKEVNGATILNLQVEKEDLIFEGAADKSLIIEVNDTGTDGEFFPREGITPYHLLKMVQEAGAPDRELLITFTLSGKFTPFNLAVIGTGDTVENPTDWEDAYATYTQGTGVLKITVPCTLKAAA